MKLKIEQIALCPPNPVAAMELLREMGVDEWSSDHVKADGAVFGKPASNEANLSFNYSLLEAAREFEILHYTDGDNWMRIGGREPSASHLGCHCTNDELTQWRVFFRERNIRVAQEVVTSSHTNPVIAGKRTYRYVIFDTRSILGIDLKFIVRRDVEVA